MNDPIPPISSNPPALKTSALAIWSLVLGILSLVCCSIFSAVPGAICGHLAMSKIKKSGGLLKGHGLAIGGLVTSYIGIALAIFMIPMMIAIALPNFVKARQTSQKNACINNLRIIEDAKQRWVVEKEKAATDTPTNEDLAPYFQNTGGALPKCPAGGVYQLNAGSEVPTCSVPEHRLEPSR